MYIYIYIYIYILISEAVWTNFDLNSCTVPSLQLVNHKKCYFHAHKLHRNGKTLIRTSKTPLLKIIIAPSYKLRIVSYWSNVTRGRSITLRWWYQQFLFLFVFHRRPVVQLFNIVYELTSVEQNITFSSTISRYETPRSDYNILQPHETSTIHKSQPTWICWSQRLSIFFRPLEVWKLFHPSLNRTLVTTTLKLT